MLSLVPEYKVETLYSGTGTVPEFWRGYQKKRRVHIGARRRIEPGHGARAPSVNTALHGRTSMTVRPRRTLRIPAIKGERFYVHKVNVLSLH